MSRTFTEAYLYGWYPDNPNEGTGNVRYADYVFKGTDLEFAELSERVGELKDTAKVEVHNPHGVYTDEDAAVLDHGDRIEFQTRRKNDLRAFGQGLFGTGVFQPDLHLRWTGLIRNYSVEADGRHVYTLEFDAEDFSYAVMSMRNVTNAWEDEKIVSGSGSGQGIINTILENECPEIDLSQIPDYSDTTTISLADKNVLESVIELANRADLIMYARGGTVYFEKPKDISTKFNLTADDYTLWGYTSNDDAIFNRVRVKGGQSHEPDPSAQQTTHDAWQTVSKDNRLTYQTTARKGEIERIEIWTDPTRTGNKEDYIVRIQQNDNGAPVAVGDQKSDIARKTLDYRFTSHGHWTSFIMPDHNLADPQPWIIVESSGSGGMDVGVRASDNALAYISHYPYKIRTRRDEPSSQDEYRLREETLVNDSIDSLTAARQRGDAYLRRHEHPHIEFEFDPDSDRLHDLQPGEVVRLDIPAVDASGRYVCIDRSTDWADSLETGTLTLRDLSTL